jgi:hypothetical protein
VDPDPHGSTLILVGWNNIGICTLIQAELQLLKTGVVDPDPHGSTLILVGWILIRIQNGQNDPQEKKKRFTAQAPSAFALTTHQKTALAAAESGTVFCTPRGSIIYKPLTAIDMRATLLA